MPIFLYRALIGLLLAASASAQLRLPALPLQVPTQVLPGVQGAAQTLDSLSDARHLEIGRLLRINRRFLELDPNGEPIVRGEILVLSPSEAAIDRALSKNFLIAREQIVDSLTLRLLVLRAPDSLSTKKALRILRDADPIGVYDYNHIYVGGGAVHGAPFRLAQNRLPPSPVPGGVPPVRIRLGLIDTGIDTSHPVFHGSQVHTWGCDDKPVPAAHGTAVASLMVGRTQDFHGVEPQADLFAADVFCGRPTGGATDALVAGLSWLAQSQVPVINISLVGAKNSLLETVINRLVEAGFIVVAAVGNDGPAAPPLYPASYPHVVGVTAVDAHNRVLIEAARGPQVMFAAPGAELAAAGLGKGFALVRGTSFAAPIVAALLAANLRSPNRIDATTAVKALANSAIDLGPPGRDLTYGWGLVGAQFRADPTRLINR